MMKRETREKNQSHRQKTTTTTAHTLLAHTHQRNTQTRHNSKRHTHSTLKHKYTHKPPTQNERAQHALTRRDEGMRIGIAGRVPGICSELLAGWACTKAISVGETSGVPAHLPGLFCGQKEHMEHA
jgi:hypothetical protein